MRAITENSPFGRVAIDLITGLPNTHMTNNQNVCVMTDVASKWAEAEAMPDKSAESVADAIFTNVICRHGVPVYIQSDQGPEFLNKIIARLTKRLEITHVTTTPYRPQSNGVVEVYNKTLISSLRNYAMNENMMYWDRYLDAVLFAHRTTVHSSTGYSPFQLLYGREPRLPTSIENSTEAEIEEDIVTYHTRHVYELSKAWKNVRKTLSDTRDAYKERYDAKQNGREITFTLGDLVMLYKPKLPNEAIQGSAKFTPLWDGPLTIVDISESNDVFTLRDEKDQKMFRVNVGHIKAYYENNEDNVEANSDEANKDAANANIPSSHDVIVSDDSNQSYSVRSILGHRKHRNQVLYRVNWQAPFHHEKYIEELRARQFDGYTSKSLPPMLCAYWKKFPVSERPAPFRTLQEPVAVTSTSRPSKKQRSRKKKKI